MDLHRCLGLATVLLAIVAGSPKRAMAADATTAFTGEKSSWHNGFDRYDYVMDAHTLAITPFKTPVGEHFGVQFLPKGSCRCIVIVPKTPALGNPWCWQSGSWDRDPQTDVELLQRGFHVAYITSDPGKQWNAWYAYLTAKHGLSKHPAFIDRNDRGVDAYRWATANPDKVGCIYADNPTPTPESFQKLEGLAKNDVPLIHVYSSTEMARNTLWIEDLYHQWGGRISIIILQSVARHPSTLHDPRLIADWIEQSVPPESGKPPAFVGVKYTKSSYYSFADSNRSLGSDGASATCRGPLFTACYDRYDVTTSSPLGDTTITVLAPKTAAPGKPWVFRANRLEQGEAAAVDMALLAKGLHIVAAPITAQVGPTMAAWDATYKLLTANGFSRKPVLEGSGTGIGDAYAWAILNPDKVSCLYGEYPHSLLSKTLLLDSLAPLAKAGVPLLYVCFPLDDLQVNDNMNTVEKRYQELGGQITVLRDDIDSYPPLGPSHPMPMVNFITEYAH